MEHLIVAGAGVALYAKKRRLPMIRNREPYGESSRQAVTLVSERARTD
jgi:hypothetical protein